MSTAQGRGCKQKRTKKDNGGYKELTLKVDCLLRKEEKREGIPNWGSARLYGYHARHGDSGDTTSRESREPMVHT